MSQDVENKVVSMDLDNSKFLRNADQVVKTMGTIGKSLISIPGYAEDGSEKLEEAMKNVSAGLDFVKDKFSTWGIVGMTVVENLTNRITDGLIGSIQKLGNFLKIEESTIGAISSGWDKYAKKTDYVATILAATNDPMEKVTEQMEKLNWFTDETSYNFTDMVENIGKFTSQGIALEDAVVDMEGIATWAALCGQNATVASRAMYQLAQAVGTGTVKLMDWRSIESASMATKDFKESVLEVASSGGKGVATLTKNVDKLGNVTYKTLKKGTEVGIENFNDTLQEEWFDKRALEEVLRLYGQYADGVNEVYNELNGSGYITMDILKMVDEFKEGTLDLASVADKSGVSIETLTEQFTKLSSEEYEVGKKAFEAAQKARTFTAAVDATVEAASSVWSNIWELIFGDVEKATELWSNFCEFLYNAFVNPLWDIEEEIEEFVGSGGMEKFKRGLSYLGDSFLILEENIQKLFSGGLSTVLMDISNKLAYFGIMVKRVLENLEESSSLEVFVKSIKNIFDFVKQIISPIKEAFNTIFQTKTINNFTDVLRKGINDFNIFTTKLKISEETGKKIKTIFEAVFKVIKDVFTFVTNLIPKFKPLLDVGGRILKIIFNATAAIASLITGEENASESTDILTSTINLLADGLHWVIDKIEGFAASNVWKTIKQIAGDIKDKVVEAVTKIKEKLDDMDIFDFFKLIKEATAVIAGINIAEKLGNLGMVFSAIQQAGKDLWQFIKDFRYTEAEEFGESMLKLAEAIILVAAALFIFSLIPTDKIWNAVGVLGAMFVVLGTAYALFYKYGQDGLKNTWALSMAATAMIEFAGAILLLAVALGAFALIAKMDTIWTGLLLMTIVIGELLLSMYALSKMSAKCIIAATALAIVSVALLLLAGALAAFSAVAMMSTFQDGCVAMLGMIIIITGMTAVLGEVKMKCIVAAAAILVVAVAMLLLVASLAALTALASNDHVWQGFALMALVLAAVVVALVALSSVAGPVLLASAALLVASVAITVFSAALIVAAAGIFIFVTTLSLIAAEIIGIGVLIGKAIDSVMTDVAEGITNLIASVGKGIGEGISAISKGIEDFAKSISSIGSGIEDFGDGMRSLEGISWLSTAAGVAGTAAAFNDFDEDTMVAVSEALKDFVSVISSLQQNESIATGITGVADSFGKIIKVIDDIKLKIDEALIFVQDKMAVFQMDFMHMTVFLGSEWGELCFTISDSFATAMDSVQGYLATAATTMASAFDPVIDKINQIKAFFAPDNGNGQNGGGITTPGTPGQGYTPGQGMFASGSAFQQYITDVNNLGTAMEGINPIAMIFGTTLGTEVTQGTEDAAAAASTFGTTLTTALVASLAGLPAAIKSAMTNGANAVRSTRGEYFSAGRFCGEGLRDGLLSMLDAVEAAARAIGAVAAAATRMALAVNSPSKVYRSLGLSCGEGLVMGLEWSQPEVKKAATNLVTNTMSNLASMVQNAMDESLTPVITPVLNTETLEKGVSGIASMFKDQGINANMSYNKAVSLGNSMDSGTIQNGGNPNAPVYQFTQNNYSPKALNRIEIYRQTRNQLSAAKGA